MNKKLMLIGVIFVVAMAIFYLESMKSNPKINTGENTIIENSLYPSAPELRGISGYINVDNISLATLRGKVVLIDFWTFSCINCIRTQPYLNAWYEKYRDSGFEIIGVHTPEFEFEKDYDNVAEAVRKGSIKYPVVLDNDYLTWRAYKNQYWPRKYLIDSQGRIRYDHIGEGAYDETEKEIRKLLVERNQTMKLADETNVSGINVGRIGTPEIYFGYGFNRGNFGNKEGMLPEEIINYKLPEDLEFNNAYLEGKWLSKQDYMELREDFGKIILRYSAKAVNIVAAGNATVKVLIDGKPASGIQGEDAKNSSVFVNDEKLYNVIMGNDSSENIMELYISGKGFRVYTFTFG